MTVYGPYTRKDGRKHVIHYDGKNRITQSYPRYLMEQKLGRKLLPEEEVDHADDDFTNDTLDNLQLLTPTQNRQKEMARLERQTKWFEGICPECKNPFKKELRQVKHNNIKNGKAGPFCSRSCSGRYNANNQHYGSIK